MPIPTWARTSALGGYVTGHGYGVPVFEGTCLVHIDRRKNNTQHKGQYPALGRSLGPELDVVAQLHH
jgi:hypothetical protein